MTTPEGTLPAPLDLVHPQNEGFRERVTPKLIAESKLSMFTCACGGVHFRHAGYCQIVVPFLKPEGEKRVVIDDHRVMVCVACKKCLVWVNEQMWDVTEKIDLTAWEKTEREAHKATGPGGDC